MRATLGNYILHMGICGGVELKQGPEQGAKQIQWALRTEESSVQRERLLAIGSYIRAAGGALPVHAGEIPDAVEGWLRATVAHACERWGQIG